MKQQLWVYLVPPDTTVVRVPAPAASARPLVCAAPVSGLVVVGRPAALLGVGVANGRRRPVPSDAVWHDVRGAAIHHDAVVEAAHAGGPELATVAVVVAAHRLVAVRRGVFDAVRGRHGRKRWRRRPRPRKRRWRGRGRRGRGWDRTEVTRYKVIEKKQNEVSSGCFCVGHFAR